jgi:hypothetical protein
MSRRRLVGPGGFDVTAGGIEGNYIDGFVADGARSDPLALSLETGLGPPPPGTEFQPGSGNLRKRIRLYFDGGLLPALTTLPGDAGGVTALSTITVDGGGP